MNMMKRFLWILLALCLVLACVSCNGGGGEDNGTDSGEDGTSTESVGETETDPVAQTLALIVNGESEYRIVYPEDVSGAYMRAALNLQDVLERYTGAKLRYGDDFLGHRDTEGTYEILIGPTNREASQTQLKSLRSGEFAVVSDGTKLLLCGHDAAAAEKAVNHFIRNVVKRTEGLQAGCEDGTLSFSQEQHFIQHNTYPITSFTVNGTPIEKMSIVYPKDPTMELVIANLLRRHIRIGTGYQIPVVSEEDYDGGGAILIGNTKHSTVSAADGKYGISVTEKGLEIVSDSDYGYAEAYFVFCESVMPTSNATGALKTGFTRTGADQAPADLERAGQVRIMSHNIWGTLNDHERSYLGDRNYIAKAIYEAYQPDIICLQEASQAYRSADKVFFKWLKSEYTELKLNTGDPIYYKADVFECLESGHLDINDTDNGASWAVLRHLATQELIAVINVHFPSNWGAENDLDYANQRRVLDAGTAVEAMHRIREKYTGIPVFVTGDYNCTPNDQPFFVLTAAGLTNVRNLCADVSPWGSTHTKPTYLDADDIFSLNLAMNGKIGHAIDHFTYLGENVTINRYHLLSDVLANTCADHSAHYVDFTFQTEN